LAKLSKFIACNGGYRCSVVIFKNIYAFTAGQTSGLVEKSQDEAVKSIEYAMSWGRH